MSATAEAISALIAAGVPRERVAAELVVAALIVKLAADPELVAMADTNDAERFAEGCATPAFRQKMGAALVELRDLAAA